MLKPLAFEWSPQAFIVSFKVASKPGLQKIKFKNLLKLINQTYAVFLAHAMKYF